MPYQKAVAHGTCLYDGRIEYPIYVIEQDYDYFFSMYESDGMTEEGETAVLNSNGLAYYLFFGELPAARPYSVSNMGKFFSTEEAMNWAAKNISYFVRWCHNET